jgi:hypothetical protein
LFNALVIVIWSLVIICYLEFGDWVFLFDEGKAQPGEIGNDGQSE